MSISMMSLVAPHEQRPLIHHSFEWFLDDLHSNIVLEEKLLEDEEVEEEDQYLYDFLIDDVATSELYFLKKRKQASRISYDVRQATGAPRKQLQREPLQLH
ncbi:unnamed protein product [Amoebophrya sp. A25]|nr:unnamed protein product [Amoebophrya sp. A25]|eukprot:GSA25T00009020001.1